MILITKPDNFNAGSDVSVEYGYLNIEFPQIDKNSINMQFESIYIEKTLMSGKIIRVLKGRRFHASWRYPYLSENQIRVLTNVLKINNGRTELQFPVPNVPNSDISGYYSCYALLSFNGDNNRFKLDPDDDHGEITPAEKEEAGKYVWKDFTITAIAEDIV